MAGWKVTVTGLNHLGQRRSLFAFLVDTEDEADAVIADLVEKFPRDMVGQPEIEKSVIP